MRSLFLFITLGVLFSAPAQVTNSWIKPGSGNWEDQTAWSLGVRPAQNQTIMLTNQGWKAIAIGSATAASFPQSLNVNSVVVAGNTDSFNVLLLNYAGTAVPLQASNGLSIYAGGQVQNLYSGLIVQNGLLTVSNSQFIQAGGLVVTTNASLRLDNSSYNLTNGLLQAGQVNVGWYTAASFVQDGGSASMAGLRIGKMAPGGPYGTSSYDLVQGWLYVGTLLLEAEGTSAVFNQHGGTNFAALLELSPPLASSPVSYNLSGGLFTANSVNIAGDGNSAYFNQTAGTAFITNTLTLLGGTAHGTFSHQAFYTITGGTLSARTLNISGSQGFSIYTQSNGTVRIAENIYLGGGGGSYLGRLYLAGGTLSCSNIYSSPAGGYIQQDGGALIVSNLFSCVGRYTPWDGTARYLFNGGTLSASNMELFAEWTIGSSAQAGRISNPGWLKLGFTTLHIGDADEHLGRFILITNAIDYYAWPAPVTNSFISLDGNSSRLSFANSSAETWTPGATLVIGNWNGNPSGGGAEQLKFGTSASGLTASQLARITFSNPGGFPAGKYPAKLLSTGELVPDTGSGGPPGQLVNNWTNPASGRWDSSANWSLATLPASNQIVNITNAGYKAVNIDNGTVSGFPASLTVSNLSVSAPTNGLSTVLLNYTGLSVPLRVLGGLEVNANGTLQNEYGSLEVDGADGHGFYLIGRGQYIQEGGQTVANVPFNVFDGTVNCTNGNMTLGPVTLGGGGVSYSSFVQDGGSIATYNLQINSGFYSLVSGTLYNLNGASLLPGYYYQYGGTNFGSMAVNSGGSVLYAGLMHGSVLSVGPQGDMKQQGGTIEMQTLSLYGGTGYPDGYPGFPNFVLKNGQVYCGALVIQHNGLFEQQNGLVVLTNNFDLHGASLFVTNIEYADYRLTGGLLQAPSLSLGQFAIMNQYGGTNQLTGSGLTISNTSYHLWNGRIETAYSGVGIQSWLSHDRGVHKINGVLSVTGDYELSGGTVDAAGFFLRGILTARAYYDTGNFSVSGLTDLGGTIYARMTNINLGTVRLSTNAVIDFADNINGIGWVFCANSSGTAWTAGQSLVISNWNGALNHIRFGSNSTGLTAGQLRQVVFANPAGMPGGYYPAQILSNGEVVPAPRPTLQSARYGSALVLTWPSGFRLLSATNLTGPYTPVSGATSPWTNAFSKPREFFMLQGF